MKMKSAEEIICTELELMILIEVYELNFYMNKDIMINITFIILKNYSWYSAMGSVAFVCNGRWGLFLRCNS